MRKMTQELQFLTILKHRLALTENENARDYQLRQGFEGEKELDRLQQLLMKENLSYMDDLVLSTRSSCVQIDKLLVAGNTAYVIDVKNYTGTYIFANNEWVRNGLVLQENISEQLHNAMRAVKRIFHQEKISLEVQGVLIFIHPHAHIEIQEPVADTILHYQDIPAWFLNLLTTTDSVVNTRWQTALEKNTLPAFPCQRQLPIEQLRYLKHGICCRNCGSFSTKEERSYIECSACHDREPKETAYVRTICECGLLYHHLDLTVGLISQFFGEGVNIRYLKHILDKHFVIKKYARRATNYHNQGIIFNYWFEDKIVYFEHLEKRITWKPNN